MLRLLNKQSIREKSILLYFIIVFEFLSPNIYSQSYILGFPSSGYDLPQGSIIVLNPLPWRNGNLNVKNYPDYFSQLSRFLSLNRSRVFKIRLHYASILTHKYPNYDLRVTLLQAKRLNYYLSQDTSLKSIKYSIKTLGSSQMLVPLEYYEDSLENYRNLILNLNSRVEICIE